MVKHSRMAREREFYHYYPSSEPTQISIPGGNPPRPTSSTDTAITSFAQLGTLRYNAARCIISLIGSKSEYVLAEASRTLSLQEDTVHDQGDQLWYGAGALKARSQIGTILIDLLTEEDEQNQTLPYISVNDLQVDDRFKHVTLVTEVPFARSLVCMPLRSRGHIIGLYCLIDDRVRSEPSEVERQFLMDMAVTTMNHLESGRVKRRHDRAERMVKALALFLEGKDSLRDWWLNQAAQGDSIQQYRINESSRQGVTLNQQVESVFGVQDGPDRYSTIRTTDIEDSRRTSPQSSEAITEHDFVDEQGGIVGSRNNDVSAEERTGSQGSSTTYKPPSMVSGNSTVGTGATSASTGEPTCPPKPEDLSSNPEIDVIASKLHQDAKLSKDIRSLFSRASNLMREAMQLEGVAFFDASFNTYGAGTFGDDMKPQAPGAHSTLSLTDTTSSGSDAHISSGHEERSQSSIDSPANVMGFSTRNRSSLQNHADSERLGPFQEKLLRWLAKRYPHGKIFNFEEDGSISSSDPENSAGALSEVDHIAESEVSTNIGNAPLPHTSRTRKSKRTLSRHAAAAAILKVIPTARSVAWFPLWNSASERWFAGTLAWVSSPQRILTPEDELIHMTAWSNSIMAEVSRLTALVAARMKVDFVSSISHELRSPLHGILASVEFLHEEENMSPIQIDMINTIHSCGKTLLDTIDHVLDFAKLTSKKKPKVSRRGTAKSSDENFRSEPKDTSEETVNLCKLTEEVVDSVYAGRNWSKLVNDSGSVHMAVLVVLDISWQPDWNFKINVGAFRRVLMNLLSNSLKYTNSGYVKVAVTLDRPRPPLHKHSHSVLHLTVTDSGKGISRKFLQDHLYTAFRQEDALNVGTGLGLSIVRQIVHDVHASIDIESEVGSGTKVSVRMPLKSGKHHVSNSQLFDSTLRKVREELRGRRVCLVNEGFNIYPSVSNAATGILSPEAEGLMVFKSCLASMLTDWLNVEVSTTSILNLESGEVILAMASPDIADRIRLMDAQLADQRRQSIVLILSAATDRGLDFVADNGTIVLHLRLPIFPHQITYMLHEVLCKDPSSSEDIEYNQSFASQDSTQPAAQGVLSSLQIDSSRPSLASRRTPSRVQLPERPALPIEDSIDTTPSNASVPNPLLPNTHKVLLVEDNAINLKLLTMNMKRLQQSHTPANNGRQAVEAYKAAPADIVFMDINMPIMDGLEASREIRRYENDNGLVPTTIVALTGAVSLSTRRDAFASGVDLFLTKPVAMKVLREVLTVLRDKGREAVRVFDGYGKSES